MSLCHPSLCLGWYHSFMHSAVPVWLTEGSTGILDHGHERFHLEEPIVLERSALLVVVMVLIRITREHCMI